MIRRKSEIEGNVINNLRGGDGHVTAFNFLTEQEAKGAGRLFAKMVIEPGNSVGFHKHEGDMEAYYILKGKGLVSDNGNETVMEAGDSHVCPDGQSHSLKNVGEDALEFVAVILYTKQKDV